MVFFQDSLGFGYIDGILGGNFPRQFQYPVQVGADDGVFG